jgi:hypothetical protein
MSGIAATISSTQAQLAAYSDVTRLDIAVVAMSQAIPLAGSINAPKTVWNNNRITETG